MRDTTATYVKDLGSLFKADDSRLQPIKIESSNLTDPVATIKGLMDVDHIDMVMANAGGAGAKGIIPLDVASPEIVTGCVYREGSRSIGPVPGCQASVGEGSSSQVGVCEQCCGFDWST